MALSKINILLSNEELDMLDEEAAANGRTRSAQARFILQAYLYSNSAEGDEEPEFDEADFVPEGYVHPTDEELAGYLDSMLSRSDAAQPEATAPPVESDSTARAATGC